MNKFIPISLASRISYTSTDSFAFLQPYHQDQKQISEKLIGTGAKLPGALARWLWPAYFCSQSRDPFRFPVPEIYDACRQINSLCMFYSAQRTCERPAPGPARWHFPGARLEPNAGRVHANRQVGAEDQIHTNYWGTDSLEWAQDQVNSADSDPVNLSFPRMINFKFPLQPYRRNISHTQNEELGFS